MSVNQFVKYAIRTENKIDNVIVEDAQQLVDLLRAFCAIAELLDMFKKNVFYRRSIDVQKWNTTARILQTYASRLNQGHYRNLDMPVILDVNTRLFHAIVGAATESGELVEHLLNMLDGREDRVGILEEFGDINWYAAIAVDELDSDFDVVLTTVINKLRTRFPERYTDENANVRNVEVERETLEQGLLNNIDPQTLKGQDL